jgi:hypothetical protein
MEGASAKSRIATPGIAELSDCPERSPTAPLVPFRRCSAREAENDRTQLVQLMTPARGYVRTTCQPVICSSLLAAETIEHTGPALSHPSSGVGNLAGVYGSPCCSLGLMMLLCSLGDLISIHVSGIHEFLLQILAAHRMEHIPH